MSKRNVIHHSCLPSRLPLASLGTLAIALDLYTDMPGWAWGVYGTLCCLVMAGYAMSALAETRKPLQGFGERPEQDRG